MRGLYKEWPLAQAASGGYDQEHILAKTLAAALAVKSGRARYERDTILFHDSAACYPMLALAFWLASGQDGNLKVLDYGGSLGSQYFQHLGFFQNLKALHWSVVEQRGVVQAGNTHLANRQISFHEHLESACADGVPDLIMLGSVLQYLPHPHETLSDLFALGSKCLFIDRTPFWAGDQHLISVQHVPEEIYRASYPCWIFSKPLFASSIPENYRELDHFANDDWMPAPVQYAYEGHIYVKK